jgi:hypothetical protein
MSFSQHRISWSRVADVLVAATNPHRVLVAAVAVVVAGTAAGAVACTDGMAPVERSMSVPTTATNTLTAQTTSTGGWTAGDSSAQTEVSIGTVTSGTYSVVTTLGAGVASYAFTGLSPSTEYEWRVRHVKNGQYSSYLWSSFTTSGSSGTLQPPTNPAAMSPAPTLATVSWTNSGENGVSTEIWQSRDGVTFSLAVTANPSASSYTVRNEPSNTIVHFKMRHVKSGSPASAYTTIVSCTAR